MSIVLTPKRALKLHQFTLDTERQLRACETFKPSGTQSEATLFLALDHQPRVNPIVLEPIQSPKNWQSYTALRTQIERAFGLTDPHQIRHIVKDIQTKQKQLQGQWYLAQDPETEAYCGAIGLVPFLFEGQILGRVQDVDILPAFQNQGLGNRLLSALIHKAQSKKLKGLVLMAKTNDWPLQWYQRKGFKLLGQAEI